MAIFRELTVLSDLPPAEDDASGMRQPLSAGLDAKRPLSPSRAAKILADRKPEWLKIRPPAGEKYSEIKSMLRERKLNTVCEEAHCPNVAECWAGGTATFMLGGEICTRACRFCAIQTARTPPALDPEEPYHVASSVAQLGLHYVVLTSVDRDDLADGGAGHFAATIREIKRLNSEIIVEALVPDFRGDTSAIETIVDSGLDVYAHNIETTRSLQYRVRDPRAGYLQSLLTLEYAKKYAKANRARSIPLYTKSSIMLGLGETREELLEAFQDLRTYGVDVLTLGQYLRPSMKHLPVERYWSPEEFGVLEKESKEFGFFYVAAGPMVRSSYRAGEFFLRNQIVDQKRRNQHAVSTS